MTVSRKPIAIGPIVLLYDSNKALQHILVSYFDLLTHTQTLTLSRDVRRSWDASLKISWGHLGESAGIRIFVLWVKVEFETKYSESNKGTLGHLFCSLDI